MSRIILLSGGTGVGTSSIAISIAQILGLDYIDRTDAIREVLRQSIAEGISPALFKSTFEVGMTTNYDTKDESVRQAEVIRGYKNQAGAVQVGIAALVKRTMQEGKSAVIEGVHILPGLNTEIFGTEVNEVSLALFDEEIHKKRFYSREEESPHRNSNKYLANFREIRWIHDYIVERANRNGVHVVNNQSTIDESVRQVLEVI